MLAHILLLLAPLALQSTDLKDDFFAAVRKNDIPAVEALLAKGVDVNVKFRYDQTALFPACDKGYTDMVKVLIAHGARFDVQDTFYHFTPIDLAIDKGHAEVIRILLEKGAPGKENALLSGVDGNFPAVVKVVLGVGDVKPEAMSRALAHAIRDKHNDMVEMLKTAGAVPPPPADFKVDDETLKLYAGSYESPTGPPLAWVYKDGKLTGGVVGRQPPLTLGAFSKTRFTSIENDSLFFTFTVEDGKVTGLTLTQGTFVAQYKKSEAK